MNSISELIQRHLQNNLSDAENEELLQWVNLSRENRELFDKIVKQGKLVHDAAQVEESQERVMQQLRTTIPKLNQAPVRRFNWRLPVAAAVLVLVAVYGIMALRNTKSKIAGSPDRVPQAITDVPAPIGTRTTLTLGNGSTIILDSAKEGTLAREGNVNVSLNHSQIVYDNKTSNEKPTEVLYNTLTTAKGGQTTVVLADGSRVWLNAASSIRFPTNFKGNERRVTITGEAYFEVARNPTVPFIVQTKSADIKVLGTRFNVMAYENESSLKTTLLQGSVLVTAGEKSAYLQPGTQAQLSTGGQGAGVIQIYKANDVDTAQVVAWKNGEFQFHISDIGEVMRQLERWYDVEVTYEEGKPSLRLSGEIDRKVSLSNVIKLLEYNGAHLKLDGRKVIVSK